MTPVCCAINPAHGRCLSVKCFVPRAPCVPCGSWNIENKGSYCVEWMPTNCHAAVNSTAVQSWFRRGCSEFAVCPQGVLRPTRLAPGSCMGMYACVPQMHDASSSTLASWNLTHSVRKAWEATPTSSSSPSSTTAAVPVQFVGLHMVPPALLHHHCLLHPHWQPCCLPHLPLSSPPHPLGSILTTGAARYTPNFEHYQGLPTQ